MSEATVAELLDKAAADLADCSDTPMLDAELLLARNMVCPRSHLYAWPDKPVDPAAAGGFANAIERRRDGEPVAYIVGSQEFWSIELTVTPAVLIPRPETELLVEAGLALVEDSIGMRVLELGTGSGAVALAIKRERPTWKVVATDESGDAMAMARINRESLGLDVELRKGSWFEPVTGERFDLIVSNPPYVAEDDPHLPSLRFEPAIALIGGPDGLEQIRHIIANAMDHLLGDGWLLLEHGFDQGQAVRELLREAGFHDIHTRRDLAGNERVSGGRMK